MGWNNDRRIAPKPDLSTFCRMIVQGGVYEEKRYVSESAVRQMTSTQTRNLLNQGKGEGGYGLGWSNSRKARGGTSDPVIPGGFGHGGAYSTNLSIDPEHRLITVFMVQHAGYPGVDGGKIHSAFTRAAFDSFAK
jgi:CubicO group peptidase (beta-lactamase class C family)